MTYGVFFALRFFGLILSAITTVFTVILWSELPQGQFTTFLMGLAGFALEGCKFLLLILAVIFYQRRQYLPAITSGLLTALLFVVSIAASVGFLEKSEQQQKQQSWQWRQIRQEIDQVNQEILLMTDSARRDIEIGYRERGLDTQERINTLRQQRSELMSEPVSTIANSSFDGVSALLGFDNNIVRLFAWLLLAILIDGVAGACWVFLALLKHAETIVRSEQDVEAIPETLPETVSFCLANANVVPANEYDGLFISVSNKITNDEPGYDANMSLNKLMQLEAIGYGKARKVMDKIQEQKKQV